MKLNVYLSGNVRNVDESFQNWRDECLNYVQYYNNLNFIDPIKFFNYTDKKPLTDKQCIDLFMYMIEKSDVLLVNLDNSNSSCGTMMEIEHAYCNNIPIIGFGIYESWYNWAEERCSITFEDLEGAISYISSTYGVI